MSGRKEIAGRSTASSCRNPLLTNAGTSGILPLLGTDALQLLPARKLKVAPPGLKPSISATMGARVSSMYPKVKKMACTARTAGREVSAGGEGRSYNGTLELHRPLKSRAKSRQDN